MANPEHVEIVKQGAKAIDEWRKDNPGAGMDLTEANLIETDLTGANLEGASLLRVNLDGAGLMGADLSRANLKGGFLWCTDLTEANLKGTDLTRVNLLEGKLTGANLTEAYLYRTMLTDVNLTKTLFNKTRFYKTILSGLDFTAINNISDLETTIHHGASHIDHRTLELSKGKIPDIFLQRCGLAPWEILNSKMYDRNLSPAFLNEINTHMMIKRQGDPIEKIYIPESITNKVGGIFISYCHDDKAFVEKLHAALEEKGYSIWRDDHELVSGPLERQLIDAIRAHDVVLLVLSKKSIDSQWVELELEEALDMEKDLKRDILCPITLDDAWVSKLKETGSRVLWRKIKKKNILSFEDWEETEAYNNIFQKLTKGLNLYYGK